VNLKRGGSHAAMRGMGGIGLNEQEERNMEGRGASMEVVATGMIWASLVVPRYLTIPSTRQGAVLIHPARLHGAATMQRLLHGRLWLAGADCTARRAAEIAVSAS
jgi:hypothetical protein